MTTMRILQSMVDELGLLCWKVT